MLKDLLAIVQGVANLKMILAANNIITTYASSPKDR